MIVGLKRDALDALENSTLAVMPRRLRPRHAASLILIDRSGKEPRLLLGQRRADLAFMPSQFVFPGGRTDPGDAQFALLEGLPAHDARCLAAGMGAAASTRRAGALVATALRECYEETGLMLGAAGGGKATLYGNETIVPDARGLRYVARAITPPGRIRRFDTRFFAAFRDRVGAERPGGPPDQEFTRLVWATPEETQGLDCPAITRTIIQAVMQRLMDDPELTCDLPVPEYRMRHGRFVCEMRS
ncbi:MAG: NUDIX hydrolase [Rhizobiaceae bacterium]|nr:NUDIX hydrolase [Rhizobiaceae bacterium]